MRHKAQLKFERILEITHRRMNDLNNAVAAVGRTSVRQKCLVCANVHYGPWNGGAFHPDIKEMALDLSENADPNEPVLLWFWPRIVDCMGLQPEERGVDGRKKFLSNLLNMKLIRVKTEKASKAKWGSLQKSWNRSQDKNISMNPHSSHKAFPMQNVRDFYYLFNIPSSF